MGSFTDKIKAKVKDVKDAVAGAGEETKDFVADKGKEIKDTVAGAGEETKDFVADKGKEIKDTVAGAGEETKDFVADKGKEIKDTVAGAGEEPRRGSQDDPLTSYKEKEPMTPAKIKEHEPTAVKREMTEKITESGQTGTSPE